MNNEHLTVREAVSRSVGSYFDKGLAPEKGDIYAIVMEEAERGLYSAVMEYCRGNQSEATKILSQSRATVRAKLKEYDLLKHGKVGQRNEEREKIPPANARGIQIS